MTLSCPSSWTTGLCEDLIKQNKGESRHSTRSTALIKDRVDIGTPNGMFLSSRAMHRDNSSPLERAFGKLNISRIIGVKHSHLQVLIDSMTFHHFGSGRIQEGPRFLISKVVIRRSERYISCLDSDDYYFEVSTFTSWPSSVVPGEAVNATVTSAQIRLALIGHTEYELLGEKVLFCLNSPKGLPRRKVRKHPLHNCSEKAQQPTVND
ncbi:hypothetical protein J6590_030022 [Homalodisca vitripennis]|nr:hypothetical protein J6590_030022 [Homalodisca vitripennis]